MHAASWHVRCEAGARTPYLRPVGVDPVRGARGVPALQAAHEGAQQRGLLGLQEGVRHAGRAAVRHAWGNTNAVASGEWTGSQSRAC